MCITPEALVSIIQVMLVISMIVSCNNVIKILRFEIHQFIQKLFQSRNAYSVKHEGWWQYWTCHCSPDFQFHWDKHSKIILFSRAWCHSHMIALQKLC